MSSLVVGSVALDTVETPFGRVEGALGGTAVFFSLAASLFTDVKMVGVVGEDFPDTGVELLGRRGIDLSGLQRRDGETFRWVGEYGYDMNVAHTLDTQLNVFESFQPDLPKDYRDVDFVFLGNIHPSLQLDVLRQTNNPKLVALDTMNFWIERTRDELTEVIRAVDAVLINEGEIREYTGKYNILEAATDLQKLGPKYIVVKRGEYGSIMFSHDDVFLVPAFPTFEVRDTTGAGDSFAGGFIGYLDSCPALSRHELRAAAVCGTVLASYTVEGFSVEGLLRAEPSRLHERYKRLGEITHIEVPTTQVGRNLVTEGVS